MPVIACAVCDRVCGPGDFCHGCNSYVCPEHPNLHGPHVTTDHEDFFEDLDAQDDGPDRV